MGYLTAFMDTNVIIEHLGGDMPMPVRTRGYIFSVIQRR